MAVKEEEEEENTQRGSEFLNVKNNTNRDTHMHKHTDTQTDRQTDRQTHTHTHIRTDRQTHTHTHVSCPSPCKVENGLVLVRVWKPNGVPTCFAGCWRVTIHRCTHTCTLVIVLQRCGVERQQLIDGRIRIAC